jgi:hypothetical protein
MEKMYSNGAAGGANGQKASNAEKQQVFSKSIIENMRESLPWMVFMTVFLFLIGTGLLINMLRSIYDYLLGFRQTSARIYLLFVTDGIFAFYIIRTAIFLVYAVKRFRRFLKFSKSDDLETTFTLQTDYWKSMGWTIIVMIGLIICVIY